MTAHAELAETADWIDGRAAVLERIAAAVNRKVAEQLRTEVARYRGRAALIRLAAGSIPQPINREEPDR